MQKENGNIKIVKHKSRQLITPIVNDIMKSGLSGTTGVLTQTNEEALQVAGLLTKMGFPAKLIQTNNGFSLYNLYEIRYFIYHLKLKDDTFIIDNEKWLEAKYKLIKSFANSTQLELAVNIIKKFELSNTKRKYKSDFYVFLHESKLEDFITSGIDTVFVSTIHKSKGKEFDNIYLMLNQFQLNEESKKKSFICGHDKSQE